LGGPILSDGKIKMVIDLVFALLSILTFLLLGSLFTGKNHDRSTLDQNIFSILTGITLCIFMSATFVKFGISNLYLILAFSLTLIYSVIHNIKNINLPIQLAIGNFWNATLLIPTFIYAFLLNSSLWSSQLRLRNGPDTIGILSSARYLCENTSLENLKNNVVSQLGNPDFEKILKSPIDAQGNSIYKIASFTDQVNAEFLLGAKRLGLPALGATYCNTGGPEALFRFSNSIILVSVFLITLLVYSFLSKYKLDSKLKVITSLIASLNINLLAATLEGGIVQIVTIPFFLYFIFSLITKQHRNVAIGFFYLLIISLTTYYDLLFFAGLVFLLYTVANHKEILTKDRISLYRSLIYATLLATLLLPVEIFRVVNEVIGRINSLTWGGWDQGRKPTPANFLGLINWLPADGVVNTPRSFGMIVFEYMVTASFIVATISIKQKLTFFAQTLIFFYGILILQIYLISSPPFNNYIALKVGAYLAPFCALVIALLFFQKTPEKEKKSLISISRFRVGLGILFLSLNLGAVTTWVNDWNRNSFVTHIDKNLESVFEQYDVKIEGFKGAGSVQFILQGNLHYGNRSRAFSVPVDRTPGRELVYLVKKEENFKYGKNNFISIYVSIYETSDFQVWKKK